MRRFWAWSAALTGVLVLAMALTTATDVGTPMWHYTASLAAVALVGVLAWPLLRRRRIATLLMLFMGVPATATGFVMLYTRQFPFKEWITWWHCVTSFGLMLAFVAHWFHNNPRLWAFAKRLAQRDRASGALVAGAWVGVALAGAITWGSGASGAFHSRSYRALASWAIMVGVVGTYGAWLVFRVPRLRARLARTEPRNRARAAVDTSLFLTHWLVILTGFVLLYAPTLLETNGVRYVGKWWHTATSVAFLALVTLHVGFNARLLGAHARRVDEDLTSSSSRASAATPPR